ncbi:hypothetical protein [Paracoccus yeei]|uniref:hypothetical protein n=1 Tax=Paracoccus yeei TaxID=147645 RepID=UPI00117FC288|nr:hypothetical protein [Paracoccus yeei]
MDLSAFYDEDDFDDILGRSSTAKSKSRKSSSRNTTAAPREGTAGGQVENFQDIPAGKPEAPPGTIHESELAALLGISRQAVGEKVRSGILTRTARATFAYPEAVTAYCAHLREHAGRAGRPSTGSDELKAERTRLAKEQADATALKNAQLRSELVPVTDTLREWQAVLRDIRAAMLAVPSRYAASQPHLTPHDVEALTLEIKRALEGLADGND